VIAGGPGTAGRRRQSGSARRQAPRPPRAAEIVAPLTTRGNVYPTRVACRFKGKNGLVVLDQIRTVDQSRLTKRLGKIDARTAAAVQDVLEEMFAP